MESIMETFEYKLFAIPNIQNAVFTLSKNRSNLQPHKLLCSSEFGFFWYYINDKPRYLPDESDYDFTNYREFLDYIFIQSPKLEDPDIINWKDISYSYREVEKYFSIQPHEYKVPTFDKNEIYIGRKVLFACGEYGIVTDTSDDSKFRVRLCTENKSPNGACREVSQNYGDGKHTNHEHSKPEWAIIHIL